jgi:hypothetical protein
MIIIPYKTYNTFFASCLYHTEHAVQQCWQGVELLTGVKTGLRILCVLVGLVLLTLVKTNSTILVGTQNSP